MSGSRRDRDCMCMRAGAQLKVMDEVGGTRGGGRGVAKV